jgi:hypothetical protein
MYTCIFIVLIFVSPQLAHAYLDPSSGSYFLQIVIGLAAGAIFTIKTYWTVIKAYINKIFNKDKK